MDRDSSQNSLANKRPVLTRFLLFSGLSFVVFLIVMGAIIIPKVQSTYSAFLVNSNSIALNFDTRDLKVYLDNRVSVLQDLASQQTVTTAALLATVETPEAISTLNSAKILGISAPLSLYGIDGQVFYASLPVTGKIANRLQSLTDALLADSSSPVKMDLVNDATDSRLLIAVPIIYGNNPEGVLAVSLPFDLARAFPDKGLTLPGVLKVTKGDTLTGANLDEIADPFSQTAIVEPYGFTLEVIYDQTPVKEQENDLILSYGISIAIAALVSFGVITAAGFQLVYTPFQRLVIADKKISSGQKELLVSEERFALAAQGSSVGIWDWIDVNESKEYWSPQFFKLLGYENNEIPSTLEMFRELLHPDDISSTFKAVEEHLNSKVPFDVEYRLRHKTAGYRWFKGNAQASWSADGKPLRMVGSIQDIHDLKLAEDNLLSSLAEQKQLSGRLTTIIETAVDAIIIIDPLGSIQTFNASAQTLFGYTVEEVKNCNVRMLMPDPDKSQHDSYLQNYRETKQAKIIGIGRKVVGQRADGTTFPMELSVGEVIENGKLVGFVGIVRDVSMREEAENSLRRYSEELARSNADLEQFAYVASHDLKAPLRGILNLTEWIEENIKETADDETSGYLRMLKSRVTRLESLLAGLLEYARVGEGVKELLPVNLNKLVGQVVELLDGEALGFQFEYDLPSIEGVPTEISQIFHNLIGNAIKHNMDRPGRIRIHVQEEKGSNIFRIEDDGIGVPSELWDKVFEMFQTLKPRDQVEGSGMGLAIVKKLITRRGGDIWLEQPSTGTGLIVCFSLPIRCE